jgi:hypothetical protein
MKSRYSNGFPRRPHYNEKLLMKYRGDAMTLTPAPLPQVGEGTADVLPLPLAGEGWGEGGEK